MRIAIITENFLPKLDGVTRTLAMLLEHLQRQGHKALILGPESGMDQYAGAEVVGTFGLPIPVYPELKLNFFRPLFIRRLQAFQPDIIHLVDPAFLGAVGIAVANLLKKPIISSYHTNLAAYCRYFGAPFLTKPMWKYNRFLHNKCSLTFCPSPSTARILLAQGFQHVRIWPRGVDTSLFHPQRSSSALRRLWLKGASPMEKTIILYVGRVSWEKNLRLLVNTYRHMDHLRCHLVIVGNGPASTEMQRELAHLPVTFTGYLRGEALATTYASADVFAFPSLTETFGQVVLEAMASGLPVVGLLSEGVCDLIKHEHTGYLLNSDGLSEAEQVANYRQYLTRLIDNPAKRTVMGQQASKEAQQRSWYAAMESLVRGYEEVSKTNNISAAAS